MANIMAKTKRQTNAFHLLKLHHFRGRGKSLKLKGKRKTQLIIIDETKRWIVKSL